MTSDRKNQLLVYCLGRRFVGSRNLPQVALLEHPRLGRNFIKNGRTTFSEEAT